MGSLNKVNTEEDFRKWASKFDGEQLVLQLKLDGLSLSLDYEDGLFVRAVTRGDNKEGEVISPNVMLMKNFRKTLPGFTGSLRAEVMLNKADFERINSVLPDRDKYSNPRNAAAGISRRLDGMYCRYLSLIFYDISTDESEHDKITKLQSMGLTASPSYPGSVSDMVEMFEDTKTKRNSLKIGIDGVVIKVNSGEIQKSAGVLSGRPKAQIAWKFDPPGALTTLTGVTWQVGRTGVVTPLGHVVPVEIDGSTIQNVTLHNVSEINRLDIGLDDLVMLVKAGDIIPYIQSVVEHKNRKIQIPDTCPGCGERLENNSVQLFCRNRACPEKKIQQIMNFLGGTGADGFGEALVRKLFALGKLRDIEDLFSLKEEDISSIEGWGAKSAAKIISGINSVRTLTNVVFLSALGIPSISDKTAEKLLSKFHSVEKLLTLSADEISWIKDFSEISAGKVVSGLNEYKDQIRKLTSILTLKDPEHGRLSGKSFCFTGEMSKPRSYFQNLVKQNGGRNDSSVTRTTTYLVCNENKGSAKSQKAAQYGIRIIGEKEFLDLAGVIPEEDRKEITLDSLF
jgi:DNA ligase (NAD+)